MGLLGFSTISLAQGAPDRQRLIKEQLRIEEQRQQARESESREKQERGVDSRLPMETTPAIKRLPSSESPCFVVHRLTLEGDLSARFGWSLAAVAGDDGGDPPIDRCLGTEGINTVVARIQKAIVERGFTTTRVLVGRQDLGNGTLTLTLVPGRIAAIRLADASILPAGIRNAIPSRPGDPFNLRDVEQALENLKRLPTVDADIHVEPSGAPDSRPGDSDLVVKYVRGFPLRATLNLDDTGTTATGKTQAGLTVAWDGPLGLNDLAYVSLNHDGFNHAGQGTSGQAIHYSIPWDYWLLGFTASRNGYHQSVAGPSENYLYWGETRNAEVKLARLIYRDQRRKTTLAVRGFRRASNNFIDDTEVVVQRRVVGGWEGSLVHREFIGDATLDGTLAHRRGTGAFGSLRAPEEAFDEGTSRLKLYTADVNLIVPLRIGEQRLRYTALWRVQWNRTPLTPQDRFSIGGRYTVRGFDGETSLMNERGWFLRNDLGIALGASGSELYAGIDYGEVGGPSSPYLLGGHLAGGVVGLRGAFNGLNYDVYVGAPISRPEGYRTAKVTAGVNFNYSF